MDSQYNSRVQQVFSTSIVVDRSLSVINVLTIPESSIRNRTFESDSFLTAFFEGYDVSRVTSLEQALESLSEEPNLKAEALKKRLQQQTLEPPQVESFQLAPDFASLVLEVGQIPIEGSPLALHTIGDLLGAAIQLGQAFQVKSVPDGLLLIFKGIGGWACLQFGLGMGSGLREKAQELVELLLDIPLDHLRHKLKKQRKKKN